MKTVLLTNHYKNIPYTILESILKDKFEFLMLDEVSQDDLVKKSHYADYFLASGRLKIDYEVLKNAKKLKMIQRTGVGLDSLDFGAIKQYGIPVYVNQGVNSVSVAEHAVLLMLSCLRNLCVINNNTKSGVWKKQEQGTATHELCGKTIGIFGMGNIGKKVVEILSGFNVNILYNDKIRLSLEEEKRLKISYTDKDEIYKRADIISLHCPLLNDTKKMICSHSIEKMKDGVIIVNTARGELIDEADLLCALKSGKISSAGLDVHCDEPIKSCNELVSLPQVIATPHIGGVTYESFYRMMNDAVRNIILFDEGRYEEIEHNRLVMEVK